MKLFKWKNKPSGQCPVQADGYFMGHYFYFRSRWTVADIEFANTKGSWWRNDLKAYFELAFTKEYQAGWLSHRKCKWLIYRGCYKFAIFLLKNKYKKLWNNKQQ
jgi:hypothetical protein